MLLPTLEFDELMRAVAKRLNSRAPASAQCYRTLSSVDVLPVGVEDLKISPK